MEGHAWNRVMIRDYLCAECHSGLTELWRDGDYRIVCSHDQSHAGRIRKSTVDMLRARSTLEGIEIRMAYPEFVPSREFSMDTAIEELYGPQRSARRES